MQHHWFENNTCMLQTINIGSIHVESLLKVFLLSVWKNLSHVMRKPVHAICEQQRCRSACASAQLISTFVVCCLDSIVSLVSKSEISSLYLASVTAQVGLCPTRSKTWKTGFLMTWFIYGQSVSYSELVQLT